VVQMLCFPGLPLVVIEQCPFLRRGRASHEMRVRCQFHHYVLLMGCVRFEHGITRDRWEKEQVRKCMHSVTVLSHSLPFNYHENRRRMETLYCVQNVHSVLLYNDRRQICTRYYLLLRRTPVGRRVRYPLLLNNPQLTSSCLSLGGYQLGNSQTDFHQI
jgi:hypothetical protein